MSKSTPLKFYGFQRSTFYTLGNFCFHTIKCAARKYIGDRAQRTSFAHINNVPEKNLTVTLPMDYELSNVTIDVVSADVSLPEGFCSESLKVDAVSGTVTSEGEIVVAKAEMDAVSGDVDPEIKDMMEFKINAVSGSAKKYESE